MSRPSTREIERRLSRLMGDDGRPPSVKELAALVDAFLDGVSSCDAVTAEPAPEEADCGVALGALSDIGAVDQPGGPLSDIQQELEEIRSVTAEAAAAFLSCAETLEDQSGGEGLPADTGPALLQCTTDICEASAFQDIAGQRLTKITQLLRQIEFQVASAKAALGDTAAADAVRALGETVENTEKRKVEHILHGPQEAGTANTQEEIDKILASFN